MSDILGNVLKEYTKRESNMVSKLDKLKQEAYCIAKENSPSCGVLPYYLNSKLRVLFINADSKNSLSFSCEKIYKEFENWNLSTSTRRMAKLAYSYGKINYNILPSLFSKDFTPQKGMPAFAFMDISGILKNISEILNKYDGILEYTYKEIELLSPYLIIANGFKSEIEKTILSTIINISSHPSTNDNLFEFNYKEKTNGLSKKGYIVFLPDDLCSEEIDDKTVYESLISSLKRICFI